MSLCFSGFLLPFLNIIHAIQISKRRQSKDFTPSRFNPLKYIQPPQPRYSPSLLPLFTYWLLFEEQLRRNLDQQYISQQMKNILSKQLWDGSEPDFEEVQNQLKQCQANSSKEIFPSSKKFKSCASHATSKRISFTAQNRRRFQTKIQNTEQPLSSKLQLTGGEESAHSLMGGRSLSTNAPFKGNLSKLGLIKRKKKWLELKDVIMNQKVNGLRQLFCTKIKRNNQYSEPIHYDYEGDTSHKSLLYTKGIELKEIEEKIASIISIYNIVSSIFVFTLSLVFPEIKENLFVKIHQIIGVCIFIIELFLNFITVKFSLGRKLENVKEISFDYLHHKFAIDSCNILFMIVSLIAKDSFVDYFRIITLFKLQDCMEKLEKLEVFFIENYYNEQYWSLVKVFIFNFCFAHSLAIILIAMSHVNTHQNWLVTKNLINAPWYEKYIWSYYWGTTIMLTIGFGDIVPVCYQQALCMVFIETISCIVLAYNINCVGSLIANIRSQDIEKSKNMKIFKKLVDKNDISESLTWRINNYIEEHTNIKKLFNIEEEVQFVSKLPTAFRTDYLKQANKTIFQKVFFFNHLMQKSLFSLAEKIEMKITHPEQVILNVSRNFDIFILKNGQIGYVSRKINRKYNKTVFDRKKMQETDSPFLLNTNFITKNRSNYGIKSIVYSVLYCLEYDNLIDILKEAHLDYELYCRQRDKNKNRIDEFEVFPCQFCPKQKHTKFSCPKLHFMPITQHIVNKYLFREKLDKNQRITSFERIQTVKQSSLTRYLYNKEIYDEKKEEEEAASSIAKKVKRQRFVIDQLKSIDNAQVENESFTSNKKLKLSNFDVLSKLQSKFLENTTEVIKIQINKALGVEKGEDEVWLMDLDKMKNYKDYFAENNPCNLGIVFNNEQRLKKVMEKNVYEVLTNIFTSSTKLGFESMLYNSEEVESSDLQNISSMEK